MCDWSLQAFSYTHGAAALAFLLGISSIVVFNSADMRANRWFKRDWRAEICMVEDVGVAYRGDCHLQQTSYVTSNQEFAECAGGWESDSNAARVEQDWKNTMVGKCAIRGNRDFHTVGGLNEKSAAERSLQWTTARLPRHRLNCQDSYLPWASVSVSNGSGIIGSVTKSQRRCAFEFGATDPSVVGNWDDIELLLSRLRMYRRSRSPIDCWVLHGDSCIVALTQERLLVQEENDENRIVLTIAVLFGLSAICMGCSALYSCMLSLGPSRTYLPPLKSGDYQPVSQHDAGDHTGQVRCVSV
jgi:hypothetical protein